MKPVLFVAGLLLVLGVIAAACGDAEEEAGITFEVSFDGDRCQYKGPEAIGEGEVVTVLNNLTDSSAVHLHVVKLDEGKTQQDFVEHVGDALSIDPLPIWVSAIFRSELVEGSPRTEKYLLDPGSYTIVCAEHLTFPIRTAAPLIEVRPNSSE